MKTNRMCPCFSMDTQLTWKQTGCVHALAWIRSSHGKRCTVVKTAPRLSGNAADNDCPGYNSASQPGFCSGTSEPPLGVDNEALLPGRERRTNKLTGLCWVQRKLHSPKFWGPTPLPKEPLLISVQRDKCLYGVPISVPKRMLSFRFPQYL